jgi:hypothetical protein
MAIDDEATAQRLQRAVVDRLGASYGCIRVLVLDVSSSTA